MIEVNAKGFIYFFQGRLTRLIKIGWTLEVASRFTGCQVGSPDELDILAVLSLFEPERVEREIHRYFWKFNIRGEWFTPAKPILEMIAGIKDGTFNEKFFSPQAVSARVEKSRFGAFSGKRKNRRSTDDTLSHELREFRHANGLRRKMTKVEKEASKTVRMAFEQAFKQ